MRVFPPISPSSPSVSQAHDPLALRKSERVARMISDLRLGLPVALIGGPQPALVYPVETMSPERFAALGPDRVLVLTGRRAESLRQSGMPEVALFPVPADARMDWVQALADPSRRMPGSAALPPAPQSDPTAVHRAAIRLVKAAELVPAALVVTGPDVIDVALRHDLGILSADDVLAQLLLARDPQPVSDARVPMLAARNGRLHVFRAKDGGPEHYAVEIGQPDRDQPVLVRLHSACFTGDVLGSLKCDCGPQLQAALRAMESHGTGVLLYLNQEGRGIGLANKMRAYSLQDQGLDTVEANHRLGFEDDERDFRTGAALLRQMGIGRVRLMTNNPAKIARLDSEGIEVVERVSLQVGRGPDNTRYLDTKARKSGHLLA
ncbi:GTP cyclohydrolase II [Paracoccus aestuarii]|uniref:GTP cyclohydrolase-2 n=1 Tax=Paracoccus aestuarii TaxID=453842 RepID=A0A419A243_9RHOB|nr:GTP cyclohydrolase II [Paracoccus aestuarii]RJL06998.1 GTP cyclohydrolase II [Paracoccus aestuarii]WCR00513.1 GTP cyclohydrolase II [Paracoccus aestuarii]